MSRGRLPLLSRRASLGRLGAAALALGLPGVGAGAAGVAPSPEEAFEFAADFDPARAVWLGFGDGHDEITAALAAALKPHAALKYLLRDEADAGRLTALLTARGVPLDGIEFLYDPAAGYFTRDLAVFARGREGGVGVVDFRATLYGTTVWCQHRYAHAPADEAACIEHGLTVAAGRTQVDRAIARRFHAVVHPTPLAAEGGGIEANGRGVLIANEPFWASRNPGLTREEIERELLKLPGIRKVLWLPAGLAEDVHLRGTITGDYVAWGAGGHTDQFVRFADERTVLLAWPDDASVAAHPVARLTRRRMQRNFEVLLGGTDARGRRLRVVKVPMPRPIERKVVLSEDADTAWSHEWTAAFFPPQERRRQGQTLTQVATATYLNFVLANGALVLPDYRPHGTPPEQQERVRRLFESVLPGRRVSFVDAITANWVGGGLHCATVNEPAPGA